jgi:ABC-type transport system involved in multi-copper enzyme maturation permease subunit
MIRADSLLGAIAGESLKMVRRPAIYVLGAIMLVILVVLFYLLPYLVLSHPPPGTRLPAGVTPAELKKAFYPVNMVREALSNASVLGGVLALILGVLAVGSEYGWGTLKTILTLRPDRLEVFLAKVVAVAATLAVFAILNLVTAALISVVLGLVDGQSLAFPDFLQIVAGFGTTWLIWNWYAAFGGVLAYSFRQSALAIGIGLAYLLVVETLVFNVLGQVGGTLLQTIEKLLPGPNASALIQSFGSATPAASQGTPPPIAGAWQATLAVLLYLLAALAASAILLRSRDVT